MSGKEISGSRFSILNDLENQSAKVNNTVKDVTGKVAVNKEKNMEDLNAASKNKGVLIDGLKSGSFNDEGPVCLEEPNRVLNGTGLEVNGLSMEVMGKSPMA